MKKTTLFLLITTLLSACLPRDVQVPQSPLLPFLERKAGLIAYIGLDGNVYTSDQAGRHLTPVTDDAQVPDGQSGAFLFYQYPAWTTDGNRLAVAAASGRDGAQTLSEIFVKTTGEDGVQKIYSSESRHPFYLYWSPDNTTLSFLSSDSTGQEILLQSISTDGGDPIILDVGSPYYWSWAPDGRTMIVHTGGAATSSTPEHLAFLNTGSTVVEDALDSIPASFQAPAWSPDGSRILYTRLNEGKKEIVLADSSGAFEKSLAEFSFNTSFAWSPDSQLVAYIDGGSQTTAGTLGKLHVVELEKSDDFFQDDDVFAFFWSPNNRKLAYFKPRVINDDTGQQVLVLELHMLDTVSGETKQLFTFQPSNQFSAILPYFDQYHQSFTLWSPDSNNLVLSFIDQQGNPGIAIVAASGQLEPRILTGGYLAVWSWK